MPRGCRPGSLPARLARLPRAWPGTSPRSGHGWPRGVGPTAPRPHRCFALQPWAAHACGGLHLCMCTAGSLQLHCLRPACCSAACRCTHDCKLRRWPRPHQMSTWARVQARQKGRAWSQQQQQRQAVQQAPAAGADHSLPTKRTRLSSTEAEQPLMPEAVAADPAAPGAHLSEPQPQPQSQRGQSVQVCNDTVCGRQVSTCASLHCCLPAVSADPAAGRGYTNCWPQTQA